MTKRRGVLFVLVALAAAACSSAYGSEAPGDAATATSSPSGAATGPADLTAALRAITDQPKYEQSDWGYVVLDEETGEVLASRERRQDVRPRLDDEELRGLRRAPPLRRTTTGSARPSTGSGRSRAARWTETSCWSARVT